MRKRLIVVGIGAAALAVGLLAWPDKPATKTAAQEAPRTEEVLVAPVPTVTERTDEPAVVHANVPTKDEASDPVFFAKWGGGDGELGREQPTEGNPQGPMSFAVDGSGNMTVLDGVNRRLVRRTSDGKSQTQKIDVIYAEDVAVGADGSAAVLDRFQDKAVALYDANGREIGKLPLQGDLLPDPGSVTGVFVDGSDVYAERDHGPLVKLGDTKGTQAEERSEIPGRPTRDGLSYLKAGIIDAGAGRVYVVSTERANETHRFTRELRLGSRVRMILLLDADRAGTIHFAAEVVGATGDTEVQLHCLDGGSGVPTGSAVLPANTLPEESFRDYAVLDGGGVIQALRTDSGVSYTRYDCM